MSGFIVGGNIGGVNRVCMADQSCDERDDEIAALPPVIVKFIAVDTMVFDRSSFQSPWWPGSGNILGWDGTDTHLLMPPAASKYPWITLGCNGRLSVVGTTRDQYGSPLGACVVKMFRAGNHELVAIVTSEATGYYTITSPYSEAHYLVVHGPGGVAGATADTITPV